MRALPATGCSAGNEMRTDIRGIVHYGSSTGTPQTEAGDINEDCVEEPVEKLVPIVSKTVGTPPFYQELEDVTISRDSRGFSIWLMNGTTFKVQWGDPTLGQIMNNNNTWNATQNVIQLDEGNKWQYLVIQSAFVLPHPIHLHGHDFFILEQNIGNFDPATANFNLNNPPRRDTALMPGGGYLVMAWETDNPGAWLLHCHIGWHTVYVVFGDPRRGMELTCYTGKDWLFNSWRDLVKSNQLLIMLQ